MQTFETLQHNNPFWGFNNGGNNNNNNNNNKKNYQK